MASTQTVIIDFQADLTSLGTAIDTLEQMGIVNSEVAATFRKTNAEVVKNGKVLDDLSKKSQTTTRTFSSLADLMKQYPKSGMNRFLLQLGNELAGAGVNVADFFKKMKRGSDDTEPKIKSLRQELKNVREQMQQAAISGGVLGQEYLRLKKRAGELDDTIRDVNNDIKNSGSDTRGIDNVVGSISALAGGYSAVQGAAALFGSESEDLQKALLKVNGAMALATGLQQISNAVTKQGSLVRLADAAATGFQSAAQVIYTAVTGRATAATIAFKIALAATGIGAVILLVVALSQAFKKSSKDMDDATSSIDRYSRELEGLNIILEQNLSLDLSRARLAGKAESDLIRIRGNSLLKQRAAIVETNAALSKQRDSYTDVNAAIKANNAIEENRIKLQQVDVDLLNTQNDLQTQLKEERSTAAKEALDRQKELNQKALEAAKKQRALEFEDFKAGIEIKLLAAEQGSEEELSLRKKLANAQLLIDLEGENLSKNQRKLLVQQFFKERIDLQKKFNKDGIAAALANERNLLDAQLQNLSLGEEEKLSVRLDFLQIAAAQEILEAEGNAAKIKLINAKLNADISAAKIDSIRKTANDEAALLAATGGSGRRALEAVAANEKFKADIRINAIKQLSDIELDAIQKQINANREANVIIGADTKALNIEYLQLLDQKAAATEAMEKKITDLTLSENEKRRQSDLKNISTTLSALQEVGSILADFQANSQQRMTNEIEGKKREVAELLEAGAITEKEGKARNKRIEAEERAAKHKAAVQQKSLAIFQATITGAQAIVQAIASAPPPFNLAAIIITSALVAAQIAAIASRPIPKFATGKKGSYKGAGIVGEAGAELVTRGDGSMWVSDKPTLTYLGSKDKVFTASETKQMLPFVNKEAIRANGKTFEFDYNKMAAAVKQKPGSTNINIDKDFISESVKDGLSRVNYFDRYYSSK